MIITVLLKCVYRCFVAKVSGVQEGTITTVTNPLLCEVLDMFRWLIMVVGAI